MSKLTDEWGFFTPMPECVIERTAEIGSDAVFLFMYFRYRTNKERGCAFPKYETMCEDIGWGRRRIKIAIDKLEEFEYLRRRKRFGKSTEYFLTQPPDVGGTTIEETTSISTTEILHENDGTVFPQRDSSISTTEPSVFPPTVKDSRLSLTKTEFNQTELKDSPSFSQDNWVKALLVIDLDYYPGRARHFERDWSGTGYVGRQDRKFVVSCRDEEQQLWLKDRGKKIAENILVGILGERVEVEFVVAEGPGTLRVEI